MCSVPPKFFQVCRLCLMLIEDDISAHKIYGTTSVSNNPNNECKCKIKVDNIKSCKTSEKCCSCDKNNSIPNLASSIPRVPSNTNLFKNNKLDENISNKIIESDICKPIFSTTFGTTDEFKESMKSHSCSNEVNTDFPKQLCCDDSSDNIIIQILKCLSLEVSIIYSAAVEWN